MSPRPIHPLARGRWLLLAAVLASTSACALAAAAGAAGAIAYTERNASSRIDASVAQVTVATEAVLQEMGVRVQTRQDATDGSEVKLRADRDGMDVSIDITRRSARMTDVVVTAREGLVEYRPGYAGEILERIITRTR
jgi:hypothetical protein